MTQNSTNETALFTEYYATKNASLLDVIMEKYAYIAKILTRRFAGKGLEEDDIYQSACIGLMNAAKRFDPTRGIQFASYATPTILGEIKRLFRDKGNCVKVPRKMYEIFSKVNKIRNEELVKTGKMLSLPELSEALNITIEELSSALFWEDAQKVHSLDAQMDEDIFLSDCIGITDEEFLMIENKDFLSRLTASLTDEEKQFLQYRFYEEMTQAEIAKLLNTSQMNISRLEKKVLSRLREMSNKV